MNAIDTKVVTNDNGKAEIEVTKKEVFNGDMKTMIIPSTEMEETISDFFGSVLSDYVGCRVRINDGNSRPIVKQLYEPGSIYVDIFFKNNPEADGFIKSINTVSSTVDNETKDSKEANKKPNALAQRLMRYSRITGTYSGRNFVVSEDTYSILSSFLPNRYIPRWAEHTFESVQQTDSYGKDEVVVGITGLDINKILSQIYGGSTKDARYEYLASPTGLYRYGSSDFIMTVIQLDSDVVRRLQNALGIGQVHPISYNRYR